MGNDIDQYCGIYCPNSEAPKYNKYKFILKW